MYNPVSKIIAICFNERLDFRARIFNTLGFLGIGLGLFFGSFSIYVKSGPISILGNYAAAVFAGFAIWRANSTGNFRRYFLLSVVVVFLILFPVIFFTSGGIKGGTPPFFVFAVVFTVIMLEGRRRTVVTRY
jgi:hypothetical protein